MQVSFGPVDTLNPDCGYQLRITNDNGQTILFTSVAPDTGRALCSPSDCLRVVLMYLTPNHLNLRPARRVAPVEAAEAPATGV
jgi:hypothetical protein